MSAANNLRDQVERDLEGAIAEHDNVRAVLKRIDKQAPELAGLTLEIRHCLMAMNARYIGIRTTLGAHTMCGTLEARTAQEPVAGLPLFVMATREDCEAAARRRILPSLHRAGDHTLDPDEVMESEVRS